MSLYEYIYSAGMENTLLKVILAKVLTPSRILDDAKQEIRIRWLEVDVDESKKPNQIWAYAVQIGCQAAQMCVRENAYIARLNDGSFRLGKGGKVRVSEGILHPMSIDEASPDELSCSWDPEELDTVVDEGVSKECVEELLVTVGAVRLNNTLRRCLHLARSGFQLRLITQKPETLLHTNISLLSAIARTSKEGYRIPAKYNHKIRVA